MNEFLQKLINSDSKISEFSSDAQVIHQGLAPILALTNNSLSIQKANLLERVKLDNWQTQAKILFSKLTNKNIDFLVFKGFSFTHLLYNGTNLRPYSDIDIIIDKGDYDLASNILIELNYRCYSSRQGKYVSFQNSFYDNDSPQTIIDLHWQINNRIEFHQHFPFEFLQKDATTIQFNEVSFQTPNLIKSFIIGCFHYQAHRPDDRKHIWLYDLALIWNQMNSEDKLSCIDIAKNTCQFTIVQHTLFQLDKVFTNCLNISAFKNIETDEATEDYLQIRNKKITDIKTRLHNIKGTKNKIQFLSEYVFQNPNYVKNRYHLKSKFWVLFYYPRMWTEDIFKLFK